MEQKFVSTCGAGKNNGWFIFDKREDVCDELAVVLVTSSPELEHDTLHGPVILTNPWALVLTFVKLGIDPEEVPIHMVPCVVEIFEEPLESTPGNSSRRSCSEVVGHGGKVKVLLPHRDDHAVIFAY